MTRCEAFWNKVEKIRDDPDAMKEFCEKSPDMIRQIAAHSHYLERHVEKLEKSDLSLITEKSARPLRKLERQNPTLHDQALDLVLCEGMSPKKAVALVTEQPDFIPKLYDIWSFGFRDPRYGQEGYKWGLICGQIVENLLHYYTEEGDLVLDPMAGGGTTIDVCNAWNRRCLAFDIEPVRDDIIKNDITKGLPEEVQDVRLAILEPPYYNMMQDAYKSLNEYLDFLYDAIKHTAERLAPDGILALIVMDQVNKDQEKYPLIGPSYRLLEHACLEYEHLVGLPLATEQHTAYHVEWAKKGKFMLGINRQMWIFRRPA